MHIYKYKIYTFLILYILLTQNKYWISQNYFKANNLDNIKFEISLHVKKIYS